MVCSLLGCVDCAAAQSAPQTGAEAFILMDAGSGRVLTGKNTEPGACDCEHDEDHDGARGT